MFTASPPTRTAIAYTSHSHHHQRTVTGVLPCMQDRANKICDPTSEQKEFQHLQAVFQANGFPAELVKKTLSHQTCPTPPQLVHEDPTESRKIMCLPYIRDLSERIERICTPLGVKAAFKPTKTLRQTVMNVKNCIREERKREVVYEVPCKECHLSYIGETKCKHKQAVKRRGPEEWHSS